MNKAEFQKVYHVVKQNLYWVDAKDNKDLSKFIEKKYQFKFIDSETLANKIEQLKAFDINLIWDKSFWGLSKIESISYVASEPYNFLLKLKMVV